MLKDGPTLAIVAVDTAENEPSNVCSIEDRYAELLASCNNRSEQFGEAEAREQEAVAAEASPFNKGLHVWVRILRDVKVYECNFGGLVLGFTEAAFCN